MIGASSISFMLKEEGLFAASTDIYKNKTRTPPTMTITRMTENQTMLVVRAIFTDTLRDRRIRAVPMGRGCLMKIIRDRISSNMR